LPYDSRGFVFNYIGSSLVSLLRDLTFKTGFLTLSTLLFSAIVSLRVVSF
jgi:hypothetical protein